MMMMLCYPLSFVLLFLFLSLSRSLSVLFFSLCVYLCMYAYSPRFLLPIADIAARTTTKTTKTTTTTITSLRINNESLLPFMGFSLLFNSFIVCACVYRKQKDCRFVLRPNNKMMILATFGLLFCCNRTISFLLFLFILIDALPCVCMSVGVLCTPFFFLYFILYLSIFLLVLYDRHRQKHEKRKKY